MQARGGPRPWMLALAFLAATAAGAAEQTVLFRNADAPVAQVVVEVLGDGIPPARPAPVPAVMDQVNLAFVPRQLVVARGSRVSFPNSDATRHQVYSFSPAKRFELPLYSGTPPEPVLFDTAGVVTLGCNIHDAMIGFIVVVESSRWAVSDAEGRASLGALPAGEYRLRFWHERIAGGPQTRVLAVSDEAKTHLIEVPLEPPPPPRGSERLRALQDRLRGGTRERD
ncbi:MAG: hypothetical protein KatS3mg126_2481 [Lysobacteraceae bacterium]|nr:MAG: hypothetical protein KatS3mg126_2481 [Xanthomonadaceae bacterium]